MKSRVIALGLILTMTATLFSGCTSIIKKQTAAVNEATSDSDNLYDGQYYIWHDSKEDNIEKDLHRTSNRKGNDVDELFTPVYAGGMDNNDTDSLQYFYSTTTGEHKIPTLFTGDKLVYHSTKEVPMTIKVTRMKDDGYSIGLYDIKKYNDTNLYYINTGDNFVDSITKTDTASATVAQESTDKEINNVFISTVGKKTLVPKMLTESGIIANLKKEGKYDVCYSFGTMQSKATFVADVHFFSHMEDFELKDMTFIDDNLVEVNIPAYFKSGYYFMEGFGLFRYVDGNSWDEKTDFNDPIIIRDADGSVISDPSRESTELYEEDEDRVTNNTDSKTEQTDTMYKEVEVTLEENQVIKITSSGELSETDAAITAAPYATYRLKGGDPKSATTVDISSGEAIVSGQAPGTYIVSFYNYDNYTNVSINATAEDPAVPE